MRTVITRFEREAERSLMLLTNATCDVNDCKDDRLDLLRVTM